MIACLDVDYQGMTAHAAGVAFRDWPDAVPAAERVVSVSGIKPYVSGRFFLRELPCLLAVLRALPPVAVAVIDGCVWLGGETKPGLGAHLHAALGGHVAVIGVAKSPFQGVAAVCEVRRGKSNRPLFVTAIGISAEAAANHVRAMHGSWRIPTLLRRVDGLARGHIAPLALEP